MPTYNPVDFGAIGDGNVANAAANTQAFQEAIAAAAGKGAIYVPTSDGFVVDNGSLRITQANQIIFGDASMASVDPSPTSRIIGRGPGSTLEINTQGCSISGLAFQSGTVGEQKGGDAFILATVSPVKFRDLFFLSPNVGISLQLPTNLDGEFWIEDVLVEGTVGVAGIVVNAGNAAVCVRHVVMDAAGVQPPYGICVTSVGELIVSDGCDIINMGTCLAIIPGIGGVKGQFANAIFVSDSLFDGGNGPGCVYICPHTDAYVGMVRFSNCWASTANNNNGTWNTNGFTLDGTQSKPEFTALLPIQDVSLVNCVGRSFVNHAGFYAKGVQGLSIANSTFGGCFNGILIDTGCSNFVLSGNRCGNYTPPPVGSQFGGNVAYGIVIEPNADFIVMGNLCYGNAVGGVRNAQVLPGQIIALNLP